MLVESFANHMHSIPLQISMQSVETSLQNEQGIGQRQFTQLVNPNVASLSKAPSNGRVMLIDGTAVIYRAYYKLLVCLSLISCHGGVHDGMEKGIRTQLMLAIQ